MDLVSDRLPLVGDVVRIVQPGEPTPRSSATQHMIFDAVKCCGSPRTSQMPRSGACQCAAACSTWAMTIGHSSSGICSRDRVCR